MRALAVLVVFLAMRASAATTEGDAVLAKAREAEVEQLRALAGSSVALHTRGWVHDGKTKRNTESFRRLEYGAAGSVANVFERGLVDGKPVSEAELRKAIGVDAHPPARHREVLTYALTPLTSPDIEVTAGGPAPGGGYTLRCEVKGGAVVKRIVLVVDAQTGRKRTATLEMAGLKAKLADRLETLLTYGDDGAPAELRVDFHAKIAWIERSAAFRTRRVPAPPRR